MEDFQCPAIASFHPYDDFIKAAFCCEDPAQAITPISAEHAVNHNQRLTRVGGRSTLRPACVGESLKFDKRRRWFFGFQGGVPRHEENRLQHCHSFGSRDVF